MTERFGWLLVLLGLIWGVQVFNLATGYTLNNWFGLRPRSLAGLDGILFMPVLHGSFSHAVANSVPLIVLGGLLSATARSLVLPASMIVIGMGGLGVWIFGQTAIHVGASGLIFGWFGFLVARGLVEKRLVPILAASAVTLIYGTMIWGILPLQPGVSWESHLFGALAGGIAAFLLRQKPNASA